LVLHLCVLLFTRELDTGEDRTAVTGYVIVNYKRRGDVGLGVVGVLFRGILEVEHNFKNRFICLFMHVIQVYTLSNCSVYMESFNGIHHRTFINVSYNLHCVLYVSICMLYIKYMLGVSCFSLILNVSYVFFIYNIKRFDLFVQYNIGAIFTG
jgi:hypothetical protein